VVRVLVVDDSMAMRRFLTRELGKDPEIEVVGAAPDPFVARDMIFERNPEVLTLDLEMPRMDGLTFLRRIMKHRPMPVIVYSSLTTEGGAKALEALAAGAVDVMGKPSSVEGAADAAEELADRLKVVARASFVRDAVAGRRDTPATPAPQATARGRDRLLAIGASTGGTVAVESIFTNLRPGEARGVVVQHMPEVFTRSFADRLARVCELDIREARDGDPLLAGSVLIAPGGRHLVIRRVGHELYAEIKAGPTVNGHRPSIDVTFASIAECAAAQTVAVILTGMGRDGARGLLQIHDAGGRTVAQDEASSVVFGMPKVAIELGAADQVSPLVQMPSRIAKLLDDDGGRDARIMAL
jgi:two-component system chemotaxis response regulator CheB